uniref:Uncharacterized protein n=1 Tax=Glossina pallidipes TaxID=7398 RepID=A0A1A9ZGZ1_GLOPL
MVFNSSTSNTSTHMHADYEIHLSLLAIASSNQTTTQISRISSTIINTMSTETSYESANFDPTIFSGSSACEVISIVIKMSETNNNGDVENRESSDSFSIRFINRNLGQEYVYAYLRVVLIVKDNISRWVRKGFVILIIGPKFTKEQKVCHLGMEEENLRAIKDQQEAAMKATVINRKVTVTTFPVKLERSIPKLMYAEYVAIMKTKSLTH